MNSFNNQKNIPGRVQFVLVLVLAFTMISCGNGTYSAGKQADQILKTAGVTGGLIVVLGCDDPALIAGFGADDEYLVHGLVTDVVSVTKTREHIRSKGLYGRVSLGNFDGGRLPYADNMVNLLVADGTVHVDMVRLEVEAVRK